MPGQKKIMLIPGYRILTEDAKNQNAGIYLAPLEVRGGLMIPQNDFFNLMSSIAKPILIPSLIQEG